MMPQGIIWNILGDASWHHLGSKRPLSTGKNRPSDTFLIAQHNT